MEMLMGMPKGTSTGTPRILVLEGALRENGGLRVNHGLVRQWTAEGQPARLLVLENVAPTMPMFTPDPEVPWTYASSQVRRFRTALPFVLAGLVRHCRWADVVISGSEVGWQLPLGWLVTRVVRRPFFVLVQSPLNQAVEEWQPAALRRVLLWVHRHVDRAMCISAGLVPQVIANGLDPRRVAVTPVGIDVDRVIRRGRADQGWGPRPGGEPPVLFAMGRLDPVKGFDVLIDASARLRAEGIVHRVVIAGEGPERAALQARVERHGLQGVVQLPGHLAEPQRILAGADAFVLSSRREGNGSLALLEALAHGRPIVAADCETGPRELLRDGRLGDLVPPGDAEALATALGRHLRGPARLRAAAAGGPDMAREFDQAATAWRLARYIRGELRLRSRPHRG
jgi:glycosyltransferase involved in cell wall biosynthesis